MSTHELSSADREQIQRLISQQRPGRLGEILAFEGQESAITVRTGISRSENSGIGYLFSATKRDGKWVVEEVESWQA